MHPRVWNHFFTAIFIGICLFSHSHVVSLNITAAKDLLPSNEAAVSNSIMYSIDMAEKASHILVGKVESIKSHWDEEERSIYTVVKVYVEECLKGTIQGEYVVIKQRGGELADIGLRVSTEPRFFLGEKVKVFLNLEETGEFTVSDEWRGKVSLVSPSSSGFSYAGFHWNPNDLPVPYYINQDGTLDVPGVIEEFHAVQACFQTWEDDLGSVMDYTYMGTTSRSNESLDGYNVVSWQPIDGPGGTLAQTAYWYNPSTQLMTEFDIVFDEDETWSATGELGKHDIQNVGTHEAGHTLILADLYDLADSEQTMYGYSSLGETKKRTLEAGDIAGIRSIYPSSKPLYTLTTSPSGLQIEVDGTAYTSPQSFEWAPNSTHTIYVPSNQSAGTNTRYVFVEWDDGGAQRHQITVGASSLTISASYRMQYFSTIAAQGLEPAYPATIKFTQFGDSKTASSSELWGDWCDSGSALTIDKYVLGEEGQRWITYNTTSWTVNSALTATLNYVLQYEVSMTFKTNDQIAIIQPTQVEILGGSPNNTLVTLEYYSNIWLNNVTWTLKQILWQNSNVIDLDAPSVRIIPKYEWRVICRVYPVSFEAAFKNFKGAELSSNPSSFMLQFPNGTVSAQLTPSSAYYLQNGTTEWKSITWQGVEVTPTDAYFDPTDGNPTVNCLIYDFLVKISDFLGFPVPGAHVLAELSNGRTVNTWTGSDGVAVIRMAPQGGFTASTSYLTQTVRVSGEVTEAAFEPIEVKITFGLFVLLLLSVPCVLAAFLVVFLILRMTKMKQAQIGSSPS